VCVESSAKNKQLILFSLTPQITSGKKHGDEGAALFGVRVNLPC